MKISLLCDDKNSWFVPYMIDLHKTLNKLGMDVESFYSVDELIEGELLFILSCQTILRKTVLEKYELPLVVHASDVPKGRGWSPVTWQVLDGENDIPLSLFKAEERVDSGEVYLQKTIKLKGTELNEEIKRLQAEKTKELILEFIEGYPNVIPVKQNGEPTYYTRRRPEHSLINIEKSISEQMNLLRVVDNERYPAFFYYKDKKYILKIYEEE